MSNIFNAGMSELADETDSKSVIREGVRVQVPLPAPAYGSQPVLGFAGFSFYPEIALFLSFDPG